MQPAKAVHDGKWEEGGREKSMYIHILELFLHMTMLLEAVPVYIFSNNKSILVRNTHYCIVAYMDNFWILEHE